MNQIQKLLDFGGIQVSMWYIDGTPWFIAKEICYLLEVANVSSAVSRLPSETRNTLVLNDGTPGSPFNVIVNEEGLYTLVMSSRKKSTEPFKRWVLGEVLPSIRETGVYIPKPQLPLPSYAIEDEEQRANRWIEEQREKKRLQSQCNLLDQRVQEWAPKISYLDEILQSTDTVTVTQIANDYGITAPALNKILKDERVQYKTGGQWGLYREFLGRGLTKSHTNSIPTGDGRTRVIMTTRWTQAGRLFIHDILSRRDIYANVDRSLSHEAVYIH